MKISLYNVGVGRVWGGSLQPIGPGVVELDKAAFEALWRLYADHHNTKCTINGRTVRVVVAKSNFLGATPAVLVADGGAMQITLLTHITGRYFSCVFAIGAAHKNSLQVAHNGYSGKRLITAAERVIRNTLGTTT